MSNPWIKNGVKVHHDIHGYGNVISAKRSETTVQFNCGALTVKVKELRSVGQHSVEFTQFHNNPAHKNKLQEAQREAKEVGAGTRVIKEDHGTFTSFHVVPSKCPAPKGELVFYV